jgi:uncharacterized protein (TIGR00375 family)
MKIFSDLHIHSRFSRATSKELNIGNLVKYARMKGINLLGTGDFTHPLWLKELKGELREDGSGILKSSEGFNFILSAEIANIYAQDDRQRRIHNIVLAKDFETVDQINEWLSKRGRLDYDGRPIFGFGCAELVENVIGISKECLVIPAHIWTPWFSLFGSKSGFNRIEDCFQDQTKNIFALETGLSSDPQMNWRLSSLDRYRLVSFSDLHSFWPWRIGREATVFDLGEPAYDKIADAIRTGEGLAETIEVDPSYGKYHHDGHRGCGVSLTPEEARRLNNICPVCRKPLTIGVLHRIEELADRGVGFVPKGSKPFRSLVPLSEIISISIGSPLNSRKVWGEYNKLVNAFGSELSVLMEAEGDRLGNVTNERTADLILKVRAGDAEIRAGYDGVYGEIVLSGGKTKGLKGPQRTLKDFDQ